jgi:hypothetical protein
MADTWTQKADFAGGPRYLATGFNISNKGYIGLGGDNMGFTRQDFWEYDPITNHWTQIAPFPGGQRSSAVGFGIGSKGYVGTGWMNGPTNDFWEYDPALNKWTQKAQFGGIERASAVAFSINGKGYIGTGQGYFPNNRTYTNDFWEYDPQTDRWTQKADFEGGSRAFATGFGLKGKGYIGAGNSSHDFWQYDPLTNDWSRKEDFGTRGVGSAIGFSINNKGYMGIGWSNGPNYDFWEYDPANESTYLWSNGATTPSIPATTSGSYTVRVTNSAGCSAVSDPLTVTVRPVPSFTAQVTDVSCMGANDGKITINATGGNGTYSYSKNGSPFVPGNTFTGLAAATYQVITGSNDCASLPQNIVVGVGRDTIAPNIICPNNITVAPASSKGTVIKFPKPVATDNCVVKSKEQISGLLSGSMFPIGTTTISYEATDGSGNSTKCSFTITVTDANKYGMKLAIPGIVGIDVFPNPGNGRFVLQLNNMNPSNASVLIMDAKGTIIQRKEISKASFSNTILFDLGRKAAGIYIVKFVSAESVYATRVLVEQ